MKEYKLRIFKMIWNYGGFMIILYVGFKIIILMLEMFRRAATEEQKLLWIVLMVLFGFAWKVKIPDFESHIKIWRDEKE